jgi:hypothetical protein
LAPIPSASLDSVAGDRKDPILAYSAGLLYRRIPFLD